LTWRTKPQKLSASTQQADRKYFKPRIDRVFPFAQIVEAHRYMESNQQIGKIVVTV
jgi:NADPH:quinone reductase-like Zn-dependent oxidoreductase